MTREDATRLPAASTYHYVAICGIALAVIFLVQLQLGLLLTNLLGVLVGAMALVSKLRLGPLLLVSLVAGAQLAPQVRAARQPGIMEVADVLLCAAVLGYVVGHYRLQSIWFRLLPTDTRVSSGPPRHFWRWFRRRAAPVAERRAANQLTPQEFVWFVLSLPLGAIVAQAVCALLPRDGYALDLPMPLVQILVVLWLLGVGFLVVWAILSLEKQRRHDAASAELYLQDVLWRETRAEQRRVNRRLAAGSSGRARATVTRDLSVNTSANR